MVYPSSGSNCEKGSGGDRVISQQHMPPESPEQGETTSWTIPDSQLSLLPSEAWQTSICYKTTYMVCE